MRELDDVILQLLEVIPEEKSELRQALESWYMSLDPLTAWNEVGDILYQYIFTDFYPEVSWQADVEKIWTGDDEPDLLDYTNF